MPARRCKPQLASLFKFSLISLARLMIFAYLCSTEKV